MIFPPLESLLAPDELEAIGGRIMLACSGGADSVYLFHLLRQWAKDSGGALIVAHVNHGTRGEESDGDETFVRDLCARYDVPFVSQVLCSEKQDESSLRNLRYQSLKSLADENECRAIAFAHHRDDQGETFLLAGLRASGIDGLSAMQPSRAIDGGYLLLRPLLTISRAQIVETLESLGHPWREDSSNQSVRYQRNYLRHQIMPQLSENFPEAVSNLARSAELCLDSRRLLASYRQLTLKGLLVAENEKGILLDGSNVEADLLRDVLRYLCRDLLKNVSSSTPGGLPEELLSAAVVAAQKSDHEWRHDIAGRGSVLIANGFVLILRDGFHEWDCFAELLQGRFFQETNGTLDDHFKIDRVPCIDNPNTVICLDEEKLVGALRMARLGSLKKISLRGGRSKDVSTTLREARVPALLRDRCCCVADDQGIIWIPGIRQAAHTLVTEETKSILRLRWLN